MNEEIRSRAKEKGVYLWQVADELKIHDTNFSKMLRHQLSPEKESEILSIIDKLAIKNVLDDLERR